MDNRSDRDQELGSVQTRKTWVPPSVQEMSAGSAEDAKGKGKDIVNPS